MWGESKLLCAFSVSQLEAQKELLVHLALAHAGGRKLEGLLDTESLFLKLMTRYYRNQ